jgi:hypothetical protein
MNLTTHWGSCAQELLSLPATRAPGCFAFENILKGILIFLSHVRSTRKFRLLFVDQISKVCGFSTEKRKVFSW